MSRAEQTFNWLGMNQVQTPVLLPDPMKSPCRTLCSTQVTQQQLARQQESRSVYIQPLLQAHKGHLLSVHSSCRKNLETQVINCSSPKSWFPPKNLLFCFVLFCMDTGSQVDFYFFFTSSSFSIQHFPSQTSCRQADNMPPSTPGTRVPDFHAISEPVTYIRAASPGCQSQLTGETLLSSVLDALTHEGFLPGSSTLVGRAC